jgi:biopolymer transport protein ExbD
MSAGGGSGAEGDFDLNIAPIVDCFTVLIAYLLVSMSFISLGIFDVGVAATGDPTQVVAQPEKPPEFPLTLSVAMNMANKLDVHLTGGIMHIDQTTTLEAQPGGYDLDGLKVNLEKLKNLYPDIKEVNISADPTVKYKAIVQVIEAAKSKIEKAFLASG